MIEKRFQAGLYEGEAVDEAVKTYAPWGTFEVEDDAGARVVRVRAAEGVDELRLADELGNYALGVTIERSRRAGAAR